MRDLDGSWAGISRNADDVDKDCPSRGSKPHNCVSATNTPVVASMDMSRVQVTIETQELHCTNLVELCRGSRRSGVSSSRSKATTIAESGADGGSTSASAVALDCSALAELRNCCRDACGLLGVDFQGDGLGGVGKDLTGEFGRAFFGVEETTGGRDNVGAALGEVVELCELDFDFNGLAGFDGLEDVFREVGVGHALVDTSERNFCRGRRDCQLIVGSIVEERFLVEQLIVGFGSVSESDFDLAVLELRQLDGQGRVSLCEVNGSSANGGGQDGEAWQRVSHRVWLRWKDVLDEFVAELCDGRALAVILIP
jgi:hypothetical protein